MTFRRFVTASAAVCALLATASVASAGWDEGVAAFRAGNFEQAIAEFRQFVEERPDQQVGYQMLGRSLLSGGKPGEAVQAFQKALEMNADDVGSRVMLSQALYRSGKPRDSIQTISRVDIGSLPDNVKVQVYQTRAASHARLGETGRAAADLGRVADLKPNDAKARFDQGQMLHSDAQLEPAIAAYERAVSMDGSQADWKKTLVNALKVSARRAQGDAKTRIYGKAEQHARSLVASNPSYDNLLDLGEVQFGGKRYDVAASTLQQAISKRSDDWHSHFYLGQVYTALERFVDAEAPLNTALRLASGDDEETVWKQLGFVFEKQKKFNQSIAAYQKGNDPAGVSRVRENEQIAQENLEADEFNATIEKLKEEQEKIKRQLEEIPGAAGDPPR